MKPHITFTPEDYRFYNYCGKDSAVTFEIHERHMEQLKGDQLRHYNENVQILEPLLYMENRGILYDKLGAINRRNQLVEQLNVAQAKINLLSGFRLKWDSAGEIFLRAVTTHGKKKKVFNNWDDLANNCYKDSIPLVKELRKIINESPTLSTIGKIETLLEAGLSVDGDQFKEYLYETLKLPVQYNTNKQTQQKTITTDYEALLRLSKETKIEDPTAFQVVQLAIELRALQTRSRMLEISADPDQRIRCGYNAVGSYTGRVTSYTSPTGSGYNLQTIPNYTNPSDAPGGVLGDRDLFIADPDYWFFQCDLKGADGWTVAAYCAMLGDRTMLDDYLYGLKPHNIMTLMLRGVKADYSDREELKYLTAKERFDKDAWDVFACKRVFHGGNYLEGGITISRNIIKDSEGKLWLPPKECESMRNNCMFARYKGIQIWHKWMSRKLKDCPGIPYLIAASGQKCYFFDRPSDNLTKAVAFEPQANTTYATNKAMLNLWNDKDNRERGTPLLHSGGERLDTIEPRKLSHLRIEPLHQVHDAICGQFRKTDTHWAIGKIKSYFDNPMIIAGQSITIPFDGEYGPSWGKLGEKHGGGRI